MNRLKKLRERYHVDAKKGGRVKFHGQYGTITGTDGDYLRIKLDGDSKSQLVHPLAEGLTYL